VRLNFKVGNEDVCKIEIWEDKVPNIARLLRKTLPLTAVLQHGKLVGDMVFFTIPIVAPWENSFLTEEIGAMRRRQNGGAKGAVCLYNPRQQFCIVYGDDVADEPLMISYIGEVVEGHLKLELVGTQVWLEQGRRLVLSVDDQ
jgi:hypothetical protein